ncbi:MAG: glycosyltransferase family 39 protein [Bdellovibrionales bacterium]|nr:glycosyltransferase family 39 protein [Bdellovibrionales bacterium]
MKALLSYPRLLILAAVLIVFRFILMVQFPVIADEAYYFYWGTHPAGGYYDLPPMVGWWESFLTNVSLQSWWLRLPNLITMVLVAFGIAEWTRKAVGPKSSALLALIFFFLPVPFMAVMVAPDLPLLFFTFYSSVMFFGAKGRRDYLLSGALWGAAFLSKYFAVFSLPALLIWFFYSRMKSANKKLGYEGLLWFGFGAIPFVIQHILWNATHCWANFVFNLVTRQKVSDGAWSDIMLLFIAYLLLMSTPFLWKGMFRRAPAAREATDQDSHQLERYFLFSWAVPIGIFTLTALLGRGQGLHWYVPYLPFFVMWVGVRVASPDSLERRALGIMTVSLILTITATIALNRPEDVLKPALHGRHQFEFELAFRPQEMIDNLVPSLNGMDAVALDGYSLASVFDLEFKRRLVTTPPQLLVMGTGSRFGRAYDFTSDWKNLNGKNIMMLARGEWSAHDWSRFFEATEAKWIEQNGVRYWISKGIGFKYAMYRDEVLKRAYDEFYPSFLRLPTRCELKEELR